MRNRLNLISYTLAVVSVICFASGLVILSDKGGI